MKITEVLLKLGQTRVIISPMSPTITERREKREREREQEKKRLATVFSFYSVDFGDFVCKRQKTSAEGHSQTLNQSNLVFINPGIYLHSMATLIGKSAKKQFLAYVGEFWCMSQHLLEIYR